MTINTDKNLLLLITDHAIHTEETILEFIERLSGKAQESDLLQIMSVLKNSIYTLNRGRELALANND